jgi:hypothetical protein
MSSDSPVRERAPRLPSYRRHKPTGHPIDRVVLDLQAVWSSYRARLVSPEAFLAPESKSGGPPDQSGNVACDDFDGRGLGASRGSPRAPQSPAGAARRA